jgi:hypothetical protein
MEYPGRRRHDQRLVRNYPGGFPGAILIIADKHMICKDLPKRQVIEINLGYSAGFDFLNDEVIYCCVHEMPFIRNVKLNIYEEFLLLF